jgi:hypothetical protein
LEKNLVAVATELGNVRSLLEDEGFTVVSLEGTNLKDVNAVVISGVSDDIMGIQDTTTTAPVITADGRSAEEVMKDVKQRISWQE